MTKEHIPTDLARRKWPRIYWGGCGLLVFAVLAFVLLYVYMLTQHNYRKLPEYRFPFPAKKRLLEQDALDLSKRALIMNGKHSNGMHPVLSGHKDIDGHDVFFCRKDGNSDEGWVLWWLERSGHKWEYSVGITREGDEVVCKISKPL